MAFQLRNKVSLRNLSIVMRQLKAEGEERKKLSFDALNLAKEAVQMDPGDGKSWLILGNAYFSVAFYSTHSDGYIHKALTAYGQAEKYDLPLRNYNTADLCFNKAMALFYDEKYQEALDNLSQCQRFDPSWELSKSKHESTVKFLFNLKDMVALKGKLKPRKLNGLLNVIKMNEHFRFERYPCQLLYILAGHSVQGFRCLHQRVNFASSSPQRFDGRH